MALSAEATAELQGVRGKMLKLRSEADTANERADSLAKQLKEISEQLHRTEEERNALQRQSINLNDQLYNVDSQLKETSDRLAEADASRDQLITEIKSLNHKLNTMDAAEENYKMQLDLERDRNNSLDNENAELKRKVTRYQTESDKSENDVQMLHEENCSLAQALKEAEDRIAELTSSYNQVVTENRQLEQHRRTSHHHHQHHQIAPPVVTTSPPQPTTHQSDRNSQYKQQELDRAHIDINNKDARIQQLENEVEIYQANHKILTDQLRELQQVNLDLKQQVRGSSSVDDQLADAKDQIKGLNKQLTESENRGAQYEAENEQMRRNLIDMDKQLREQKEAYGELYSQMNKTILEIQRSGGQEGVHDF